MGKGRLASALVGMGLASLAALPQAFASSAKPADDRPLVIARNMDINSLDPARSFCDTCQIYLSAVYDTLLGVSSDNRLVAQLAEKWEANKDQTQFTFHLNPKAVFSDGSPVEAKDVKWSWDRLRNLKGSPGFLFDGIKSIEAPDVRTIVVTMDAPNSEFLGIVSASYAGVINSDVASQNGATADAEAAKKDTSEPWFLKTSSGSGPFVLDSYRPNDEIRLKRNDKYWRTPAALSGVVIRQTKDAVSQLQLLENGTADVAMQIDPDTAKSLRSKDAVVRTVPSFNFLYIALSPGAKANKVPLTPEVRQAIGFAIDYKGLIEFTLGGEGDLQPAPIPNGFPGAAGLPDPVYDEGKARELLAKAGLADGFDLDAVYPNINSYGVDINLAMQKIQQDLSKVKVRVKLNPVTSPVWREQVRSAEGIPMTMGYYAPDYFGSAQYVQFFGMITGAPWANRAGAARVEGVLNKREEELLKLALASGGADMEKAYNEIGLEMIKDRVIIPVVSPNLVLAHRKNVQGVRYSVCCNLPLAEIKRD